RVRPSPEVNRVVDSAALSLQSSIGIYWLQLTRYLGGAGSVTPALVTHFKKVLVPGVRLFSESGAGSLKGTPESPTGVLPKSLSSLFKTSSGLFVPAKSRNSVGSGGTLGPPGAPTVGAAPGRSLTRKSPLGPSWPSCAFAGTLMSTKPIRSRGASHLIMPPFCGGWDARANEVVYHVDERRYR